MKQLLTFLMLVSPLAALSVFSPAAHAEISYADILADPDNPVLNQKFAQERLAGGDAKAALAAVERVLVAEPTNLSARLFRAEVLAALGADLQALGELRALRALPLPQVQRQRVGTLLRRIKDRQRKFSAQVDIAVGYRETDNAANWPLDNTILLNGEEIPTSGDRQYNVPLIDGTSVAAPVEDDTLTQSIALTGRYDLGGQNWRNGFATLTLNKNDGGDSGYLDGETSNFSAGLSYRNGRLSVTPRISHAQIENDYDERLGNYALHGLSVMTHWVANAKTRLSASLGQTYLRFEGIRKNNSTDTLSASLGVERRVSSRVNVSLGGFYQNVSSRDNTDLDKRVSGANLSVRIGLWRGHFLTLGGLAMTSEHENVYSQSYDSASQNAALGKIREDDITGLHASYLLLGSALSPKLQNLFLTLSHQANETDSNTIGFSQDRDVNALRINYAYRF